MRWSLLLLVFTVLLSGATEALAQVLVPQNGSWSYLDDGSDQGTAWRAPGFPDGSWSVGPAELGFGEGDEATVIDRGPSGNRHTTFYFRHTFFVADPGAIPALDLGVKRDDGAVVYLNGVEVFRTNMPPGPIDYLTLASRNVSNENETTFFPALVDPALLVSGDNVLAVEVHQVSLSSGDLSFDLDLAVGPDPGPLELVRGPYLQRMTSSSVVVRWRTDDLSESHLRFGSAPGSLGSSITLTTTTTEHVVEVSGLSPDTRYYYSVGTPTQTLAGDDSDHYFTTAPVPGTAGPFRIWVIGDSGECSDDPPDCITPAAVRDAYLGFAGPDIADLWLLLGDNAYGSGTDTQYTVGFFEVYPQILRNTVVWPAPGNHEFGSADSPSQSGPYYEAFTLPTQAEAGGVASGTEAYYSFDFRNVHFIALDSHDTDRTVGGAMYNWLEADLQATNQDFVIVYWHHPPYTDGSHDSDNPLDSGGRLIEMRERFVPLLEDHGVDLQLTGHSHSYERSMLIDGHHGFSSSFDPLLHGVDTGDGDPDGDGPYHKPTLGPVPHEGAVYSVVGSSSKNSGSLSPHPVMVVGVNFEGSMVVDVSGPRLDAYWIDMNGTLADHFQILKGPLAECGDGQDNDGDGLTDFPVDPGCRNAKATNEAPQCDDGIDNDDDGGIDFPADPECWSPWTMFERPHTPSGCGLGAELLLLILVIERGRRIRGWGA